MDRTLIQEILEVVEQAGIASAKLTGMGLKNEADAAAVEAMRERMYKIQMQGRIVIGEGERDEAPIDRKSTRLNSSHVSESRMPSSA